MGTTRADKHKGEEGMNQKSENQLEIFRQENPTLSSQLSGISSAVEKITECYKSGGTILVCGNGGSASDSEHIVGELMKGFLKKRPLTEEEIHRLKAVAEGEEEAAWISSHMQRGIPAISLVSQSALTTAFENDVEPKLVFAQQVMGYGRQGDVFIGLSTSGNSANVVYGAKVAKSKGMTVIGFTGREDSKLSLVGDIVLRSSEKDTYKVQEDHIKLYHLLCALVENELFER